MEAGSCQKKISIVLLIALVGFPQISETIYTAALPSVASGLGASAYMVEATLAIYFFGFAVGVVVWGTISDWIGRRRAMLAGLLIYGIGTWACGNVENVESLLGWRFLQAFGASVGSVVTQTIVRDAYVGVERSRLFSLISGVLAFSPAIGPLLGGVISQFLGWRANFFVLVIMAVVLWGWSFVLLPETRLSGVMRMTGSKIRELFFSMVSSMCLWGHIFLIGGTNAILFGFYQEAPFVFIDQMGMEPSYYGLFGLLIAGATMVAARFSYRWGIDFSSSVLIRSGACCVLVGAILFALLAITGIFEAGVLGFSAVIFVLFLIFFGIGLIIPNSLSLALKPYQMAAGTAGSIFGGFYYCIVAGCTWMMSLIHNGTEVPLSLYMIALGVIIILGSRMIVHPSIEQRVV